MQYISREDYCEENCGKENREGYMTCKNCGMLNVQTADVISKEELFMTRDEFFKQQPDEDHNSLAQKLKRAQLHIIALMKENQELKSELGKLDKKYCDALRKVGTYKKWLEETGGVEKI